MKLNKYLLASWYIDAYKSVVNTENIKNAHISNKKYERYVSCTSSFIDCKEVIDISSNIIESDMVFYYLEEHKQQFLRELKLLIDIYNDSTSKDKIICEKLKNKLKYCCNNNFIYYDIVRVIRDRLLKNWSIHCNVKEVYILVNDKNFNEILTLMSEEKYRELYYYLYGHETYLTKKDLRKEYNDFFKLELVNCLQRILNEKEFSIEDYFEKKNPKDKDRVYIKKEDREKFHKNYSIGLNELCRDIVNIINTNPYEELSQINLKEILNNYKIRR